LLEVWCDGKARGERISFMDLRPTRNDAAASKIEQPSGLNCGGQLAALLLNHRTLRLCSFVAPLPATRHNSAHQFRFMRSVRRRALQARTG
jgi:hypothetical protein